MLEWDYIYPKRSTSNPKSPITKIDFYIVKILTLKQEQLVGKKTNAMIKRTIVTPTMRAVGKDASGITIFISNGGGGIVVEESRNSGIKVAVVALEEEEGFVLGREGDFTILHHDNINNNGGSHKGASYYYEWLLWAREEMLGWLVLWHLRIVGSGCCAL